MAVEVFEQARERFLLHAFRSGRLSSKANAFSQAEALYLLSRPFVKAVALVFGHGHDIVGVDRWAVVQQVVSLDDACTAGDAQKVVILRDRFLVLERDMEVSSV